MGCLYILNDYVFKKPWWTYPSVVVSNSHTMQETKRLSNGEGKNIWTSTTEEYAIRIFATA